jgi:hypothetical protein
MIKPSRSLLLLGYIVIILANVTFFLPPEIKITDTLSFRSFTPRSIFERQEAKYVDISHITQNLMNPAWQRTQNQLPGPDKALILPQYKRRSCG